MKRVLSLVLAFVLVLGMIPTFAAGETGAQLLQQNKFVSGDQNGDLMVNKALTREELAALIAELNGKKEEAAKFAKTADYADVAKIADWAKPFVAYAKENGWMSGRTGNMFDPKAGVTAQELAAVLMNALGYKVTDANYATVVADAAKLGIKFTAEGFLTRGQAFEAMWVAVSEVKMNGKETTLGVALGRLQPTTPVVTDLAVKSVAAANLREVMVTFNNEIDAKSFDKTSVTVGGVAADAVAVEKNVVTVYSTMANQKEYTLAISSIKDVNGKELKKVSEKFTTNDFVAPTVEKVDVYGNKKLVLTFSEPVSPATASTLSNYKIDDKLFGAMITVEERVVTLTLTNRLADGAHTIAVNSNVVDFAGFRLISNNTQFAVAKDETKPALAEVVSASQTDVVVKFSEPVEGTFTASTSVLSATVAAVSTDATGATYKLTFASPYLPLAGTEITLKSVTDNYGNKADDIKFNVVPTADITRPEVKSVTVSEQNELIVEFSKAVNKATGTYTVKSTDKTPVTQNMNAAAYYVDTKTGKEVKTKIVLTTVAAAGLKAADYTVEITGVKDLTPFENVMIPYAATIKVADLTAPVISAVKYTAQTDKVGVALYVYFNEKVDVATATAKANYSYVLAGTTPVSLGDSHEVSVLADGTTVKIQLPKMTTIKAVTSLTVVNVADLAGNKVASSVVPVVAFDAASLAFSAPEAIATNKVVVTVTTGDINPLTLTASDFMVKTATDSIYVINAEYDAEYKEITLTLNENLTQDAKNDLDSTFVVVNANSNLSDIYGNKFNASTTTAINIGTVVDKIAPAATKLASATLSGTTVTMVVELTDNVVFPGTPETTAFIVDVNGKLYTVTGATCADKKLTVTFTVDPTVVKVGQTVKVSFYKTAAYADANANKLANFSFEAAIK